MKHKLFLGCDPEMFAAYTRPNDGLYDLSKTGNQFALPPIIFEDEHGVVPLSVEDWKHPLYIQEKHGDGLETRFVGDGAAMELNFNRPFTTPIEMYEAVHKSKNILVDWLKPFGFTMSDKPVINLDWRQYWDALVTKDPRHEMSVIFGCDPDKDAFNTEWSCHVQEAHRHQFRYGGGHIHLSGDPMIGEYPIPFVKLMALTVGNYCMTKASDPELEKLRAHYYGKAGKYRVQNYKDGSVGVEYRTPSNQWTSWNRADFLQLFDWVDVALDLLHDPAKGKAALFEFGEYTVDAIRTVNTELSTMVLNKLG